MRSGFLLLVIFCTWCGAVNILPNSSFEVWLDTLGVNMPLGWFTSEYLHTGSAVKDSNSNSGNFALRLIGIDTVAFASSMTIVRPGYSYEFAGFARVPGIVSGSFVLEFLTLLGSPIGTPQLIPVYYSNGYRRYGRWVTAPDSAFFLTVSALVLPGGEVYFDDVTVDDTTLTGVEEQNAAVRYNRSVRKAVSPVNFSDFESGVRVFDALGRQVGRSAIRKGVYFIIAE